jgi:hypothetical protein
MRTRLRNAVILVACCGTLLAACRSGAVPNQVLTKPAPPSVAAPVPRTSGPWAFHPSTQRQNFILDQTAVVAIRLDSAARVDTISTHAEITFTTAAGATSGSVGAFVVQSAGRAAAVPPGLTLPFPFRAEYSASGQQLGFTAPRDASPCSSLALASAQSLRDLWFRMPDTLRVGSAWSDSSSYVVCRDGIPLRATVRRAFRVVDAVEWEGHTRLDIARTARTSIDGTGTQFGESITVSGTGSGTMLYTLDTVSGDVVSADGTSALDFSVRGRLRSQSVRQTVRSSVRRN